MNTRNKALLSDKFSAALQICRRARPAVAQKVVSGIYEKAQVLRSFPEIGHRYRTENEGEIRILLYGHYRIAYLLKSPASINILGVFHGALDIDKYFP